MASNSFFFEDGKNLYGERFGSALEYELEKDTATGIPELRIKPHLLQPESIYFPMQSKFDLVCECAAKIAVTFGDFYLVIYGKKLLILGSDSKSIIVSKIKETQMSFIQIDDNLNKRVQGEIIRGIKNFLPTLDIFWQAIAYECKL